MRNPAVDQKIKNQKQIFADNDLHNIWKIFFCSTKFSFTRRETIRGHYL